ncbi:uncharacterized protein [Physcomitrium patens]|uniref:uncharacterized protein n=1 Tax=Physcomitrium patens TaxID=3218 RepID=UPI003CCD8E61
MHGEYCFQGGQRGEKKHLGGSGSGASSSFKVSETCTHTDNFVVSKTVSSGFNGSQLVPLQGYMYN